MNGFEQKKLKEYIIQHPYTYHLDSTFIILLCLLYLISMFLLMLLSFMTLSYFLDPFQSKMQSSVYFTAEDFSMHSIN